MRELPDGRWVSSHDTKSSSGEFAAAGEPFEWPEMTRQMHALGKHRTRPWKYCADCQTLWADFLAGTAQVAR